MIPTVDDNGDYLIFQNGGRPPSWICFAHVRTIREEYLVVLIIVQYLVGISAVVLIICKFQAAALKQQDQNFISKF